MLFFDKYEPLSKGLRTDKVWVYDLRSNVNLSLVSNPLSAEHLSDFEKCFCAGDFDERVESERFMAFSAESILARDKANLDIFWLKDESLDEIESLPKPSEIASMIKGDLAQAMREFESVGL